MAQFELSDAQREDLAEIARRWGVKTFELFGSALGDAFGPESDIDLLVSFRPGVRRSLFDLVAMQDELEKAVQRPVDLVTRRGIEQSANPIRRSSILSSARPIYRVPS